MPSPKPAPDMVLELCDAVGLRPSEALVVGDTTFDLEMAANARARAVAVATGVTQRRPTAKARPAWPC